MKTERPEYLSYLLRLWRETGHKEAEGYEAAVWRASLEWPEADRRRGFASLLDLFAFLKSEIRSGGPECAVEKGGVEPNKNGSQTGENAMQRSD